MAQLSEEQNKSRKLETELQAAISGKEKSQNELADLQQRYERTLKEKNTQVDSLLHKAADLESITKDLHETKKQLQVQEKNNRSNLLHIDDLKQQIQQHLDQLDQLQQLKKQKEIKEQEIFTLKKQVEDVTNAMNQLGRDHKQMYQENSSLQHKVHTLEQSLSRQQMDSRQTIAELKEELKNKENQLTHWRTEYVRISDQFVNTDAQMENTEWGTNKTKLQSQDIIDSLVFSSIQNQQEPEEANFISVNTTDVLPRFDLSDQTLSPQRQQNSSRRLPPSTSQKSSDKHIRNVVQQFITKSSPIQDRIVQTDRSSSIRSTQPSKEKAYQALPSENFQQPLIADIVRRDIEDFCRQNQMVFVEFPSENST